MPQQILGVLIGAAFGTAFVLANAQPPLNAGVATALRVLAVLALVTIVALVLRDGRHAAAAPTHPHAGGDEVDWYGTRFRLVVAAEVFLLVVGIAALRIWDGPEEAVVAWIAFVVGLHLVAFAPIWKQPGIAVPGAGLAVLGATGLVMAFTSAVARVPFVSGVLSGVTLLGCSLYAVAHGRAGRRAGAAR